jgi:peroxiredoxin Q/BCP
LDGLEAFVAKRPAPLAAHQIKLKLIMKTNCLASLLVIGSMLFPTAAAYAAIPKTGDTAPLFTGQDQDGKTLKLNSLIGKKIVLLYFYPKDNTPGCTKEACGFRDRMSGLQTNNVEVIGVSFDSAESHKQFIAQYKLNFRLLSDPDGKIVDAYGVQVVGRKMARRVSFLIGLDGKIVHVTNAGNPDTHFSEMKDAIAGLKKK